MEFEKEYQKSLERDLVTPIDPLWLEEGWDGCNQDTDHQEMVSTFTHVIIKRGRTLDPVDAYQDVLLAAQVLLHILEDRS